MVYFKYTVSYRAILAKVLKFTQVLMLMSYCAKSMRYEYDTILVSYKT